MGIRITERALTSEELAVLRKKKPIFLFWKERRLTKQELSRATGEELDFEVQRAWNANPCEPPCCPPHLLFQISPDEFLSVTFEDDYTTPVAEVPRSAFKIVRSPLTKVILSWSSSGDRVRLEPDDLGKHQAHSRYSLVPRTSILAECELFRVTEFDDELRKKLGAS